MTHGHDDFAVRVAELRRLRGMSQKDLAAELNRSESWVSQVERGVQPVERLSVLQKLADALGVSVRDLRPEAASVREDAPGPASSLDQLRVILTGHPALGVLFLPSRRRRIRPERAARFAAEVDRAWDLAHASRFAELTDVLTSLLPELEEAARLADDEARHQVDRLLARTYQAVAAAFARQGEADAAWVAADRAISAAERSGFRLDVVAGHFRMAHAFLGLHRHDQAERVAKAAVDALRPHAQREACEPELLSLYGAVLLVLAVIAAREGKRGTAREYLAQAREIASRTGDRNDFDTEFGPTNVALHAVSIAVDMGDAGEAVDLAVGLDLSVLSPERQARCYLDLAQAHVQRRHLGEATSALLQAEKHAPEMVYGHPRARDTIRDLMQLAGRRVPAELAELAERAAAQP